MHAGSMAMMLVATHAWIYVDWRIWMRRYRSAPDRTRSQRFEASCEAPVSITAPGKCQVANAAVGYWWWPLFEPSTAPRTCRTAPN